MRIVFLRSNPVAPDPRVEKEAAALIEGGHHVRVLAWDRTGTARSPLDETLQVTRYRGRASFGSGAKNFPRLVLWNLWLMWRLISQHDSYDAVHACDFDTALPALLVKRLFGKRLVYDVFDLYSAFEATSWAKRLLKRVLFRAELAVIARADATILVDKARTRQIAGARPRQLEFIYNSPAMSEQLNATPHQRVKGVTRVAYVGVLFPERGLREMIAVVADDERYVLEIGGFGPMAGEIALAASRHRNVVFHGTLDYASTLALYGECDVLFATYDPRVPNHRFSSANKLFEAMMLGKPIIVAEGTSMDEVVRKYDIGAVVEYGDVESLKRALAEFGAWETRDWDALAARSRLVYHAQYSWATMKERLLKLYTEVPRA